MPPSHIASWASAGVVYQIYPASYSDTTGNGVGDLRGILGKLDYIKSLGVDAIWISPFYKSPQVDLGYDISDYKEVDERYGTVADAEAIINGCHERGLKCLFDLVINHSSHLHEWFVESRESKTNSKRDWYYWKPAKMIDGVRHPPNNWRSFFGGSVWEWDETTQEYYLHLFTKEQPDLNWENKEVRNALYEDVIKFWLDKGLDGFRIDTANLYSKHLDFPDAPITDPSTPWQTAWQYIMEGPRLHEFLQEMRAETFAKYGAVSIGEFGGTYSDAEKATYLSGKAQQLDLAIEFDIPSIDRGSDSFFLLAKDWKLSEFKQFTASAQHLADPDLDCWPLTYLENHDQSRSVPRYASDSPEHRVASAKLLATYLLTVTGTVILYQGQEIGMINCPKEWPLEEYKDVITINEWAEMNATGDPEFIKQGLSGIQLKARDHARTPMQWDNSPQAGFSTSTDTWMRVMDSYTTINVAQQESDPTSVLAFYRQILALRKEHKDLFVNGVFTLHDKENEQTMIYSKTSGTDAALVVLNFTAEPQSFIRPPGMEKGELLFSTTAAKADGALDAFEARVYLFSDFAPLQRYLN